MNNTLSETFLGKIEKGMGLSLRNNGVRNHPPATSRQANWIESLDLCLVSRGAEHRHGARLLEGLGYLGYALHRLLSVVGVKEEEDNAKEHHKLGQALVGD